MGVRNDAGASLHGHSNNNGSNYNGINNNGSNHSQHLTNPAVANSAAMAVNDNNHLSLSELQQMAAFQQQQIQAQQSLLMAKVRFAALLQLRLQHIIFIICRTTYHVINRTYFNFTQQPISFALYFISQSVRLGFLIIFIICTFLGKLVGNLSSWLVTRDQGNRLDSWTLFWPAFVINDRIFHAGATFEVSSRATRKESDDAKYSATTANYSREASPQSRNG